MTSITLTGDVSLIGKPKNITCGISLISQTNIFFEWKKNNYISILQKEGGIAFDPCHSFDCVFIIIICL